MKNGDTPHVNRYDSPVAVDQLGQVIGDATRPSLAGRPCGFAVGHAIGDRLPASLDGRPCGFAVGHATGVRLPALLAGRPCGFAVGHAIGDPLPASLNGRPRGFTVGRAVGARLTTPRALPRPNRAPVDRPNAPTRDPKPAPSKRAA
jgi:hypothetical protein